MNNQQSTALLFVSNRCSHSRQFVQELRQLSASAAVHQINIETTPRERIPSVVRSVPTLILNTAGQQTVLVGDQAFVWLNTQKQYSQQSSQQQSQQQMSHRSGQHAAQHPGGAVAGPAVGGGGTHAGTSGEPQAWHSTEMGASFSDTYSFIDNSFTENGNGARPTGSGSGTGGGSTIPKAFAYLSASPMDVQKPQQPQVYAASQSHSRPQQQQQQQAYQRQNMPSGQGNFTPNATMAPPTQNNSGFGNMGSGFGNSHSGGGGQATDELTKRLEQLRTARENDMPNQIARIS